MAGVCVCERWLSVAWDEVKFSREQNDGKHLPCGNQTPEAECPSKEPFGICCPCVVRNPSAKLRARPGCCLLLVPPTLVPNAVMEWFKQVDMDHKKLNMRLLVQSTPAKGKRDKPLQLGPENNTVTKSLIDLAATPTDITQLRNKQGDGM